MIFLKIFFGKLSSKTYVPVFMTLKEPNYITEKELSDRLKISKVTLHKYRKEGRIPFSKVGRTIRYDYLKVIDALKYKN